MPVSGASTVQQLIICSSLDPVSAGYTSEPGSTGLGVHPGQGSLPPCGGGGGAVTGTGIRKLGGSGYHAYTGLALCGGKS